MLSLSNWQCLHTFPTLVLPHWRSQSGPSLSHDVHWRAMDVSIPRGSAYVRGTVDRLMKTRQPSDA
eukprot:9130478-Pyramimonas_sp.AAC.1